LSLTELEVAVPKQNNSYRYLIFVFLIIGLFVGLRSEFLAFVEENNIEPDQSQKGVISGNLLGALEHLSWNESIAVWVFFRDKGITDQANLDRALRERKGQLSPRVLWRRSKTLGEKAVLPGDLSLSEEYVTGVLSTGSILRHRSRWLNAISVEATPEMISKISTLPYVTRIQPVATVGMIDPARPLEGVKSNEGSQFSLAGGLDYGPSIGQLEQINVPAVHDSGFSGNGVIVMMLDTGYYKDHEALATRDILAEWDFVFDDGETQNEPEDDPNQHNHGTATWSALGGYSPGNLIGPAFNASFLLAKTEDLRSETPAEEDNYVAALEWGDTLGVDIASASLAYLLFDDPSYNYSYSDLDGNTAVISVAIDEAARRGILVCNAASNNGPGSGSIWTPADADSMIACGAVDPSNQIASFSSRGPTFDGRIKPEVVARGVDTYAAFASGGYGDTGGTSLSTPLIGGSTALVLEAHPEWGPMEIREALMSTASMVSNPDNSYGSGLIDVFGAIYEEGVELTPASFGLSTPAPGDTVPTNDIGFGWIASSNPIGGTVSYKLMVSADSLFTDHTVVWDIQTNAHTLADTLMEGTYYWKVYAYTNQSIYIVSNEIFQFYATGLTGIGGGRPSASIPKSFDLRQNFPNPFNPQTTISFDIQGEDGELSPAHLRIYDVRGKLVRTLFEGDLRSGNYQFTWDGRNDSDQSLPSGIYVYRLAVDDWSSVRKMILVK
jgi:hypothetical protein